MKTLIGVAVLVAAVESAVAQSAVLQVRVKSPDGQPVWGALVSVWAGPNDYASRYTDERGEFTRSLNAGRYRIMVRGGGFRERNETQDIVAGDTVKLEIQLSPDRHGLFAGLHFGGPARASFAIGPTYLIDPGLGAKARDDRRGKIFVLAEPGVNAARVSAGYIVTAGNLMSGWTARGSVLRRWRSENATYLGAELGGMLIGGMGPRIGVFTPISGTDRRGVVLFFDFGIGG
jgi:hypothetical protein